jgi:alanine dehydrogenase
VIAGLSSLMYFEEEQVVHRLSPQKALDAVRACLIAAATGEATPFPVVREVLPRREAVFGIKSGCHLAAGLLGLKAGGYWAHNENAGRSNHQSVVLLFDVASGCLRALLQGNRLTALRTAAAAAASIEALARPGSEVLGLHPAPLPPGTALEPQR